MDREYPPLEPEDEAMSMGEILADIEWQSEAGSEGPEFPEGFSGAGPMFAAVPLGEPWLDAATEGTTTYVLHDPYSFGGPEEQAQQVHERYAGFSAFLDRDQAEQIADHPDRSGEFYRWEGLTGVPDCTARREAEIAEGVDWDSQLDGFFPEAS